MRDTIRTTWSYLTPGQRGVFALLTAAQLFANLLDLVGIAAVGLLVMAVASGSIDFNFGGLYRLTIDETPPPLIAGLVALAALSFLLKALANLLLSLALIRYMARIEVEAKNDVPCRSVPMICASKIRLSRASKACIQSIR